MGIRRYGWDDEIPIQHPHVQAPKDILAGLLGFVLVHTGECLWIPAMPSTGQFAYGVGANHHGVEMFGHAVSPALALPSSPRRS